MLCQILRELRLALTDIRQRCGLASWSTALAADQELEWMKANPDVFSTNQLGNEHLPTTSEESDNSIVEKYTALAF